MTEETTEPAVQSKAQQKMIEDALAEERLIEEAINRKDGGWLGVLKDWSLFIIAVAFVIFQLYTTIFASIPETPMRAAHLAFVIALVFLLFPMSKTIRWLRLVDVLLAAAGLISTLYLVFNFESIIRRGAIANRLEIVLGVTLLLVILEGTRRTSGLSLCILAILFIIYARFGTIFPGMLKHPDFRWFRIVEHLYLSLEGVFGIALSVSATFLYLFVLFGSMLTAAGATDLFMKFGLAIAGKRVGGQAKVAVVTSALLGTVSGSSPANVATTGAFTIPLMIRSGYSRAFAGAVESVASTGGQIMPPIMGVAAFIMAQYLNVSYSEVAVCAIIPALLYYVACWAQVHFHSARIGLKGMDAKDIPNIKEILKAKGHMFFPLFGLIYMIIQGYSALYSAFYAIMATIVCSFIRKETRLTPKAFKNAIVATAISVAPISMATAVVGIVVGIISLTGTALLVGNSVIEMAGSNMPLVLVITMLISLLLGMGLPTSAVYIVAATFAAPILVRLGVPRMAAHMFVFYFGCLASVTPPVAVSSIVAAGLAKAPVGKTGWLAGRLAIAGFIVPFMFIYNNELLLMGDSILGTAFTCVCAFIGVVVLGAAIEKYFFCETGSLVRLLFGLASILLIFPETYSSITGLVLTVAAVYINSNEMRAGLGQPA